MITILDREGKLNSNVRCTKGCGLGKMLLSIETRGEVTPDDEVKLNYRATMHEQHHPKHEIEVIFYRDGKPHKSLEEVEAELPIQRDMRERLESLRKPKT